MSGAMSTILLWLLVINLGVAFGAGLYEGRIVVSKWITSSPEGGLHWNPEAARQDDTGRRFWAFVTTGPLTLITIGNLFVAWRTFAYFIPTMVGLMRRLDAPEAVAIAATWANLNYARHAVALIAWLAALKAFSLFYQQRG
jgi:hypothetical protein